MAPNGTYNSDQYLRRKITERTAQAQNKISEENTNRAFLAMRPTNKRKCLHAQTLVFSLLFVLFYRIYHVSSLGNNQSCIVTHRANVASSGKQTIGTVWTAPLLASTTSPSVVNLKAFKCKRNCIKVTSSPGRLSPNELS